MKLIRSSVLIVCAAFIFLLGCQAPKQFPDAGEQAKSRVTAAGGSTLLRPGLELNISVLVGGAVEIQEENKRVSETGNLTLPLLGTVPVMNKSLDDLNRLLANEYAMYFINPQVIVSLAYVEGSSSSLAPWGFVTVLGRVKSPGRVAIPSTQDLTVSRAIQLAGGFDTSARITAIKITRVGEDGAPVSVEVDLQDVGLRGKLERDLQLRADDVVFVPEQLF